MAASVKLAYLADKKLPERIAASAHSCDFTATFNQYLLLIIICHFTDSNPDAISADRNKTK
ncbi:hypothetical protein ATY81_04630 [Rhizobium sp. R72]|nr:hypothetical protein ATY81_04630 [Rhizobium sp. R72]OWW06293.1 hypothetical protein ATY80_04630 [Rhizobium sp. R711]